MSEEQDTNMVELDNNGRKLASKGDISYIPNKNPLFCPLDTYADISTIIDSGMFFPTFITGLSGNGKTVGVEQACANLGREYFRINITDETDEDDLIGGFRLVDGDMVWQDGLVIEAMLRGGILLLDEVDLGTSKIMALQSVLEGKRYIIKKTGRIIDPAPGFNIIATANTKGKGSEDGKFAGTNVLNEAFLDRFPIMIHQGYPNKEQETKILTLALKSFRMSKNGESLSTSDKGYITKIIDWVDIVRAGFDNGSLEDVISTRRAIDIMKIYVVFGKRNKAVSMATTRFDTTTQAELSRLYATLDEKEKQAERSVQAADNAKGAIEEQGNTVVNKPLTDAETLTDTKIKMRALIENVANANK